MHAADEVIMAVAQRCARARDPLVVFEESATLVRRRVPYVAAGWILVDPGTWLINGVYAEDVDPELHRGLIECELVEDDINKFWDHARLSIPAAALSASTGGELARSTRWARFYRPNGYGDELRTVFATGRSVWGHGCLTRRAEDPFFTAADVDLIARIAPHIGNAIRASYLLGWTDGGGASGTEGPDISRADLAGLVLLSDDGHIGSATPLALEWWGSETELARAIVLHEVANQARAVADGRASEPPPFARTRTRSGAWVVVRGVRLHGRVTALVIEPATRSDLAPILLALHQLTDRERQVTQLLLRGMPTAEIADELWISRETLRDHVKAIYAKLGVSSRPELAALLTHEPRVRVPPAERAERQSP